MIKAAIQNLTSLKTQAPIRVLLIRGGYMLEYKHDALPMLYHLQRWWSQN